MTPKTGILFRTLTVVVPLALFYSALFIAPGKPGPSDRGFEHTALPSVAKTTPETPSAEQEAPVQDFHHKTTARK